MHEKCFIRLLTFFGVLSSTNGLKCGETCNSTTVSVTLGSSASLPCLLQKTNQTDEATWSQNSSLLSIRPEGNVTFEDPRGGRVVVFPYLFNRGNFSILIHKLQASDVGTYCCRLSQECHRVQLSQRDVQGGGKATGWTLQWYYIVAGIGGVILLMIACSLAFEFRGMCLKRSTDSYYVNSPEIQGAENKERTARNTEREESDGHYEDMDGEAHGEDYENMQGEERDSRNEDTDGDEDNYVNAERGPCEGQYSGSERAEPDRHHGQTGHRSNTTVYENDEHDPRSVRIRPQPQNNAFREIPDQSSSSPSYYANQSEIYKPSSAGKRKKQRKRKTQSPSEYQFRNPIYGDSSMVPRT
ncbi:uncharacterized protein LOC118799745 isoform X2 [Colossoma macropomum]|uniref:uncharacterized protein LOC118799745 isoform X2 n=1 Tax=Colossoma macropomum TaxID=42526 RepID=UPI0018640320|nr:uncharacterized protein LOC118799745 isoform X2 [Colossoma macropomum]